MTLKKRTKIILLTTGILVVLGGMITVMLIFADMAFGLFGHVDIDLDPESVKMSNAIKTSCEEIYSSKWEFGGVGIYDNDETYDTRIDTKGDEKVVRIRFDLKEGLFDDSVLESMSDIYKAVMPVIMKCVDERYVSYLIKFHFAGVEISSGYMDGSILIVCMNNCETIKLEVLNGHRMSLKAVAGIFPEINQIEFHTYGSLQYDSIEDIAGFDDLQVVDFGVLLPEEDKEYILSIYPDCEIVEESYYKYKE